MLRGLLLFVLSFSVSAETLRVMSFNVRFPAKGDGPDLWETRRDMFIESIRQKDPDLMGTQELFHLQGQYVVEKLPDYQWFGVSRRGNQTDEHMGVFYKPSRLKLLKQGNFWLSETPEAPGSSSCSPSDHPGPTGSMACPLPCSVRRRRRPAPRQRWPG